MTIERNHNSGSDDARTLREEVLVGRVTDGEASPGDWSEIEMMAQRDPTLWERLAQSQRAHARLEGEVEDRIAMSEFVDVPRGAMGGVHVFATRWREYGGWAAAAVIALAWFGVQRGLPQRGHAPGTGTQSASLVPGVLSSNPDQAWTQYVDAGRKGGWVVGEMPSVMVDSAEVPNASAHEVYYIRPVLEKMKATDMQVMRVSTDEHGRRYLLPSGSYDAKTSPRGAVE